VLVVDRRRHGGRVGAEGDSVDVDEERLDAEVVSRLVEGRMGRRRQHHRRLSGGGTGPLTGRKDGEQDRLGAARGHRAHGGVRGIEQARGHADEVVLHGEEGREGRGVEAVRVGEHRQGLASDGVRLGQARVVDIGERAPTVGGQVCRLQGVQTLADLLGRHG